MYSTGASRTGSNRYESVREIKGPDQFFDSDHRHGDGGGDVRLVTCTLRLLRLGLARL